MLKLIMKSCIVSLRLVSHLGLLIPILVFALGIRMGATRFVFPAQGDSSHFVQHGIALAETGMQGISGYWSIGPQFIAAGVHKAGGSPAVAMQVSTVLFGLLLVGGLYALAFVLTGSKQTAVIASLLAASTPILVLSSTSGLSETPHMALLVSGVACCFQALRKASWKYWVVGILLFSADLYYRPYDLFLLLFGASPFLLIHFLKLPNKTKGLFVVFACLIVSVAGAPFVYITLEKKSASVGQSKLVNLAFAKYGLDSKAMWATKGIDGEEQPLSQEIKKLNEEGVITYLLKNREDITKNYFRNIVKSVRHLNAHAFTGGFHMGLFWFVLLSISCVIAGRHQKESVWYACCSIVVVPFFLSLGFIHPRWIQQCLPFYFLLLAIGLNVLFKTSSHEKGISLWMAVVVLFAIVWNASWAIRSLQDRWRDWNIAVVGEALREIIAEDDQIMCFGPSLPISFYRTNSLAYLEIPYGPIQRVADWAAVTQTDYVIVHSHSFQHFPIQAIRDNHEVVPATWQEVARYQFEKETRFGHEKDEYVVFHCKEETQ